MILHAIRHVGSYAFPHDEISINLDATPGLIAVSGPNGAGKTTIFDLITAGFYLVMPYRPGALHRNFVEKGHVVLDWSLDGHRYLSTVTVDPGTERTEATLYEVAKPLIAGPLVKDYRRAVERILGPLETFLASAYAVQNGSGAFLRMPRPERKALLTDLLGLGIFPRYHDKAKGWAGDHERELVTLRTRAGVLADRAGARPDLELRLAETRGRLTSAEDRLGACRESLASAQVVVQNVRAHRAALEPLRAQLGGTETALRDLAARHEDAQARRARNEGVLTQGPEIRAAVERDRAIAAEIITIDTQIAEARSVYETAVRAAQEAQKARGRVETTLRLAQQRKGTLERQAGLLTTVPCHGEGDYAGCAFLKDARAAVDGLPVVTKEISDAETSLAGTSTPVISNDGTTPLTANRATRVKAREALAPLLQLVGPLDAATARLEELDGVIAQCEREILAKSTERTDLQVRLEAVPELDDQVNLAQQAVNLADRQVREAQQNVTRFSLEVGQLDAQVTAALAAETELAEVQASQAPVAEDLADWTLLTRAFSASGIPALLIDQALPEIGCLATELLHECFGEQVFTIALTTQRESAAGDKLLETLDVLVCRGAEVIDATLLSGGESVLVSEALSLAIALYAATRSGRRIQTLLRDEVSAPLDVDRAPAYARMLRRAAQLGSFRHVLFVSHQPACLELADARLEVRTGTVRLV